MKRFIVEMHYKTNNGSKIEKMNIYAKDLFDAMHEADALAQRYKATAGEIYPA